MFLAKGHDVAVLDTDLFADCIFGNESIPSIPSMSVDIRELGEIVKETLPGCEIEYAEGAGPDKRCYRVDCSKIKRMLPGFKPQWDARAGASQIYEAYKKAKITSTILTEPGFIRMNQLKQLMDKGSVSEQLRWK